MLEWLPFGVEIKDIITKIPLFFKDMWLLIEQIYTLIPNSIRSVIVLATGIIIPLTIYNFIWGHK